MKTSTYADQFLGSYEAARKLGAGILRTSLVTLKARYSTGPKPAGFDAGIEAVDLGIKAFEMGMNEIEARAWYSKIQAVTR